MKIGLVGLGVVGCATREMLMASGQNAFARFDPPKGLCEPLSDCEVVFISVPVPTLTNGTQGLSILKSSILNCPEKAHIFIRSSVLPGTAAHMNGLMPWSQIYSLPEFLTQRQAHKDALTLPLIASGHGAKVLTDILHTKKILIVKTEEECEFIKYMHNSFAAMKVGFFNSMYNLCTQEGYDYNNCVDVACEVTGFIEKTHTKVPGPDGRIGFGGSCISKDLLAFVKFLNGKTGQETFLENVFRENLLRRVDINNL